LEVNGKQKELEIHKGELNMDIYNGVHYLVLILYDTWVVEME